MQQPRDTVMQQAGDEDSRISLGRWKMERRNYDRSEMTLDLPRPPVATRIFSGSVRLGGTIPALQRSAEPFRFRRSDHEDSWCSLDARGGVSGAVDRERA